VGIALKFQHLLSAVCLFALTLTAACASDDTEVIVPADTALDTEPVDTDAALPEDTGSDGPAADTDASDPNDTAPPDTAADTTGGPGSACTTSAACDSDFCLPVAPSGDGICVVRCASTQDCAGDERCVGVSGTDAEAVCVSATLCVDLDGDLAGFGPGCPFADCNDADPAIQPAAAEVCNGLDDDCDRMVDDGVAEVGDRCDTGFPGACAAGELACDGELRCEQLTAPAEESCNLIDDDCDGETDEAAGCRESGQPCASTSDCAPTLDCLEGLCRAPSVCGDGVVQAPEACDDGNANDADACTGACQLARCGDGIRQLSEACDDGNSDALDRCANDCTVTRCGDGVVQAGEACDDGNTVDADGCTNLCVPASCGDGVLQAPEQCDDGNLVETDSCTARCVSAACGDGFVQPGEVCDDGNADNSDACTNLCELAACGDGIVQLAEGCDDGNVLTESCSYGVASCTVCNAACQSTPGATSVCGDGVTSGPERCDDGNTTTESCTYGLTGCTVCSAACTLTAGAASFCGDGVATGSEACDDGNSSNTDACTTACIWARCGDGFLQSGEACDDGNSSNADTCTTVCGLARCGDGYLQTAEACDDGNGSNSDGCTNLCQSARCGDGYLQAGEACDDGNGVDTDTCTSSCLVARCGDGFQQPGEGCDDGNAVTESCAYGVAACSVCSASCRLTAGATSVCGDLVLQGAEGCDDGNTVTEACTYGQLACDVCGSACRTTAGTASYCGDGRANGPEACDDGNSNNTDTCTTACASARCGDGYLQAGEACDDGNSVNADACSNLCLVALCGDGLLQAGEACDDGNALTETCAYGATGCTVCSSSCSAVPGATSYCGDGFRDAANEGCDDGNTVTEACAYGLSSCTVCASTCVTVAGATSFCGDGALAPTEFCDDGNSSNADACNNSCTCGSAYHAQSGVCVSNVQVCALSNGTGTETWNGSSYGTCTLTACDVGYHADGNACASNEISCPLANATAATQTWTGIAYGTCTATACAATYHLESGACTSDTRSCAVANGTGSQTYALGSWGSCGIVSCNSGFHVESGACLSNTRSCVVANAAAASESWTGTGYGICTVTACIAGFALQSNSCVGGCGNGVIGSGETCDDGNTLTEECAYGDVSCTVCNASCQSIAGETDYCTDGVLDPSEYCDDGNLSDADVCNNDCACGSAYHVQSGACASNVQVCALTNGTGTETWNGSFYETCTLTACDSGYHAAGNACASNVISCSLANATAASQTWTGSAYGTCTATACASGFWLNAGTCTLLSTLGAACTANTECASGFCATGPTGTANDRCAPAGMNYIPAGTFTMGSPSSEVGRNFNETQHTVIISRSFFLAQTEVTQGQWKALSGGTNPSWFQSTAGTAQSTSNANDSGPVENLDWYAAIAFANARSAAEGLTSCYALAGCADAGSGWQDGIHSGCTGATFAGLDCTGYRLPSESEWEYAARGGITTATYLGDLSGIVDGCSTAQANLDSIAWWCINARSRSKEVGGKTANSFGLYDMLGNVREWAGDWYDTYPGTITDPTGPATGGDRVQRGGSWNDTARYARAADRSAVSANARGYALGVRLARTAPQPLGAPCTANAQCDSGFCASGPAGTVNDRCAPTNMNYIPAGTFTMGSPITEVGRSTDETQHTVTLTRSFFLGQTEVTQGQWKALSGGINHSYFQATTGTVQSFGNANDRGPVEYVDWYSAAAFANARSAAEGLTSCYTLSDCTDAADGWKDGRHSGCTDAAFAGLSCQGYRLPTESEWEYAARAGTTTATYLGNLSGIVTDCATAQANLDGIAWWCQNSASRTQAVGSKIANSLGLYDMLGNVWEWTGDFYDANYPGTVIDPTGAATGFRFYRGGSWSRNANYARAAKRFASGADRDKYVGFRLARTAPQFPLGAACTADSECASGSCATSPDGTANDRCAPAAMNYIPAGTFTMGSPSAEVGRRTDETQHTVTISRSFFLAQTEVTQGQWKALSGGTNPSWFQSTTGTAQSTANANDSGPVEQMDWYSAVAFANARSAAEGQTACYTLTGCTDAANGWKDGLHSGCTGATFSGLTCTGYRLPTESEWEYAARAGTTTATYGGDLSATTGCVTLSGTGVFAAGTAFSSLAWYDCNAASRTQATRSKLPNAFGLFDMLGNAWEWTGDWYDAIDSGAVTDSTGPATGTYRVARGGSWYPSVRDVRAAFRGYDFGAMYSYRHLGLRLARTAP